MLLVIPCYNEAARLNFTKFNDYSKRIDFLFVDDGSQDSTAKFIKERITNAKILSLGKNMGKAEAVRLGMIYAVDTLGFDQYEWIGFLDADLAIPLEDIGYFFEFLKISQNDAEVLICSRVRRLGSNIKRAWK